MLMEREDGLLQTTMLPVTSCAYSPPADSQIVSLTCAFRFAQVRSNSLDCIRLVHSAASRAGDSGEKYLGHNKKGGSARGRPRFRFPANKKAGPPPKRCPHFMANPKPWFAEIHGLPTAPAPRSRSPQRSSSSRNGCRTRTTCRRSLGSSRARRSHGCRTRTTRR